MRIETLVSRDIFAWPARISHKRLITMKIHSYIHTININGSPSTQQTNSATKLLKSIFLVCYLSTFRYFVKAMIIRVSQVRRLKEKRIMFIEVFYTRRLILQKLLLIIIKSCTESIFSTVISEMSLPSNLSSWMGDFPFLQQVM